MEPVIRISNLRKSYGDIVAVDGISFDVNKGGIFSFLGPNGAGKSTTIDILCTLSDFETGDVTIDGLDIRNDGQAIRQRIGVVYQGNMLDSLLTIQENLTLRAGLYFKDKTVIKDAVGKAIASTNLMDLKDRPYGKLSGGQRRRADIARALINTPSILFLDEPTTGLDPQTRKNIWGAIKQLQNETGMTIFLTTHYMEEAAESDYVVIIDHGRIVAEGTPVELKTKHAKDTLRLSPTSEADLRETLNRLGIEFTVKASEYVIAIPNTMAALSIIGECKGCISSVQVLQGTMDDAFIGITGRELRE